MTDAARLARLVGALALLGLLVVVGERILTAVKATITT